MDKQDLINLKEVIQSQIDGFDDKERLEYEALTHKLFKKVKMCHYLRPDLAKKALRNVPPTEVKVFSNDDLPKNKTVYYSKCHFRPVSKSGKITSRIISPVDNTGFRQRPGNPLFIFNNERECQVEWNKQIDKACEALTILIDTQSGLLLLERDKLNNSKI